uniref:Uncharacterized protein n=1 Tax=Timema bartmani TaxID=61472 RepID=A0A7R9EYV7_9NEOP|nr:unnamed protein product [Timema bartmani]
MISNNGRIGRQTCEYISEDGWIEVGDHCPTVNSIKYKSTLFSVTRADIQTTEPNFITSGEENGRGRPRYHSFIPSPSASAASSTVTVLTSSNDSTGLIPLLSARTAHRARPRIQSHIPKAYPHTTIQSPPNTNTSKHRLYNKTLKMTANRQKELNMLVATPQGPDLKQVKTPEFDLDIRTNETIQDEKVNDNDKEEDRPANKVTFVGILPQVSACMRHKMELNKTADISLQTGHTLGDKGGGREYYLITLLETKEEGGRLSRHTLGDKGGGDYLVTLLATGLGSTVSSLT